MKNSDIQICDLIESKMNEIIDTVNKMDSAIEADPLHRDLRILDWILYQVCCNEIKKPYAKVTSPIVRVSATLASDMIVHF